MAACAARPISLQEARELISIDVGDSRLDRGKIINANPSEYCANLVAFDSAQRELRFTHPPVRQFLMDPSRISPHLQHYAINLEQVNAWCGEICLTFMQGLSLDSYFTTDGIEEFSRIPGAVLQQFPSLYGADKIQRHWRHPLKPTPQDFDKSLMATITSHSTVLLKCGWASAPYISNNWLFHNKTITESSPLYADFRHFCLQPHRLWQMWYDHAETPAKLFQLMIKCGISISHLPLLLLSSMQVSAPMRRHIFETPPGPNDMTPLYYVIILGDLEVVKELLKYCMPLSLDQDRNTAIIRAAENNHNHVVDYLYRETHASVTEANTNEDNVLFHRSIQQQCRVGALTAACERTSNPTDCIVQILQECLEWCVANGHNHPLTLQPHQIQSKKEAFYLILILDSSEFFRSMSSRWVMSQEEIEDLLERLIELPDPQAGPALQSEFTKCRIHCLVPFDNAIVPHKGAAVHDENLITILLELSKLIPDVTITNLMRSRYPNLDTRDSLDRGILHSLAHRPTAHVLHNLSRANSLKQYIGQVDRSGWTPLKFAAGRSYEETAIFLLLEGADCQKVLAQDPLHINS
ncbi:hypothetical protein BDV26DRAFT_298866 [Aspergillus bertholletiae]|uniref:GPI inositol-deacylase winged helix domain-containing protein n=1 Tax=Aspergillus bertholletiae TaxID=1226010 RepID=A0A5N7AND2_9EURO|nr:hypothetical protein BDV26DRAFT_298866 [Aspergillus bertholletiae]